ncbi:MAG: hypothetical protein MZU84_03130 [Sphingobacterium sp.]|nr:hypothetical protein [Sphingobacterium sp.]
MDHPDRVVLDPDLVGGHGDVGGHRGGQPGNGDGDPMPGAAVIAQQVVDSNAVVDVAAGGVQADVEITGVGELFAHGRRGDVPADDAVEVDRVWHQEASSGSSGDDGSEDSGASGRASESKRMPSASA